MRTLHLIRHGQYHLDGKETGSLTKRGHTQAGYAARALRHLRQPAIFASTMTRAIETANIIAKEFDLPYQTSDLLREAIPSIPPRIAQPILEMMERDPNVTHDTIHEDRRRADEAYETFFQAGDANSSADTLLVCHGNIIRYLVCRALDVNVDTWAKLNVNHCGITSVSIDEQGRIRLMTFNETRHMPLDLLTD